MKNSHRMIATVGVLVILGLLTVHLESVPPVWWDEGWTLTVARNWVEHGHYGRLLLGKPIPAGINAAFHVTAAVALSFWLFGVGIVQARTVEVIVTVATLLLMYRLSRRIYDPTIALGVLLVMMLLPAYAELSPIYNGRQILGEMPAICFLLAGYLSILSASRYPVWALACAVLFWSFALITKLQVLPFWTCSLTVPFLLTVYRHDWKSCSCWAVAIFGSLAGSCILLFLTEKFLIGKSGVAEPIRGLYEVTAVVNSVPARMFALIVVGLFAIPTLVGLGYAIWVAIKNRHITEWTYSEQVKVAVLALACSWFSWFMLCSVGWIRYVFPATFFGSIFVAAMIYDLTDGYNFVYVTRKTLFLIRGRGFNKETAGVILVLVIIVSSVPRTVIAMYKTYILDADNSVEEAANFLNSQTRPGALIETYDSELLFLLNRPYHYPPDQLHVELIRRTFLYQENTSIDYDPLAANPDYLVVGPHSKKWGLYDPVLRTGAFRLQQSYKRYQIYQRVH